MLVLCGWIYSFIFGITECLQTNQGGSKQLQARKNLHSAPLDLATCVIFVEKHSQHEASAALFPVLIQWEVYVGSRTSLDVTTRKFPYLSEIKLQSPSQQLTIYWVPGSTTMLPFKVKSLSKYIIKMLHVYTSNELLIHHLTLVIFHAF
jgi:hypothetical protein